MFCTQLRKRAEWASEIPKLLASQVPKWQERSLATHDIALPSSRSRVRVDFFRLLLLSALDMSHPQDGWSRIERFFHLTGGRDVGIIFLLQETNSKNGIISYMELQTRLLSSSFELPVLPLSGASSLQATLHAFQHQILRSRYVPPPINPATILPFCTALAPLPEHAKNVLSDICPSLGDLARAATSRDGQEAIRHWLGGPMTQAEEVIGFWLNEYIAD